MFFFFVVLVYSARNLLPKKGDGRQISVLLVRRAQCKKKMSFSHFWSIVLSGVCNASVIFGVGKEKYRTEFVRGNDPTWNEETTM